MQSLDEYKNFVSTIKDPLERLDEIEVLLEFLENPRTEIEGHYDMGSISREAYETESQELDSYFNWGMPQISALKTEHADIINKRAKKAWSGHERLQFPVVWNRESYNKIEPEIRTAGLKGDWIKWLLANFTEGKDEYWTYDDRIINAAQLDMYYYWDLLKDSSVSYSCSKISNNFVTFLFNVQKVFSLKTGASSKRSPRPENPYEEKEYNELEKLIIRTMKNRKGNNKKLTWNFVLKDLRLNTNEGQTVKIRDLPAADDTMKPGILLYEDNSPTPTHQLLLSTFQKKLTYFRKLLLPK
jgi:hypothetical protein